MQCSCSACKPVIPCRLEPHCIAAAALRYTAVVQPLLPCRLLRPGICLPISNSIAPWQLMYTPAALQIAAAGYTICPLQQRYTVNGESQECLVTLVLKLDLGGWLGDHSHMAWALAPITQRLNANFVEQLLMSVVFLRDKVRGWLVTAVQGGSPNVWLGRWHPSHGA